MKLKSTIKQGDYKALIYFNEELEEFTTKFYEGARYLGENCDAFETDMHAASETAKAELNFLNRGE